MNRLTDIFKILSDETRLRILILLYQEELCVCQLSGILDVPQPKISTNLSKLRDLNLVVDERKERYVFYSLKDKNKVLIKILEGIISDVDAYSQFVIDRKGLSDKEHYLNQCTSPVINLRTGS